MVPITTTVTPSETCGGAITVVLASIMCSEPDDAPGPTDGQTTQDIQGPTSGLADFDFELRAERDRGGRRPDLSRHLFRLQCHR
jgi:large repetitive protein